MSRDCTEPRSTLPTSSAATAMNNMATFLAIARWQLRLPQLRAGASRLGAAPSHNLANVQCRNLSNVQLCNPANVQLCKLANVQCRNCDEYGHFSRDCPKEVAAPVAATAARRAICLETAPKGRDATLRMSSAGSSTAARRGICLGTAPRDATLPMSSAGSSTAMGMAISRLPSGRRLRLLQCG